MNTASNGLFQVGEDIFFAGWSSGFQTDRQARKNPGPFPFTDVYVYKYRFDEENSCLNPFKADMYDWSSNCHKVKGPNMEASGLYFRQNTV